jgi:hypothetical protein
LSALTAGDWADAWKKQYAGKDVYYCAVPPLTSGWSRYQPDQLRDAAGMLAGAYLFDWYALRSQPEYLYAAFGFWTWNPGTYDEKRARLRIYSDVFGPTAAAAAMSFDDAYLAAAALFTGEVKNAKGRSVFDRLPLAEVRKQPELGRHLKAMSSALETIAATAKDETLLSPGTLQEQYLVPMRAEVKVLEQFLKTGG